MKISICLFFYHPVKNDLFLIFQGLSGSPLISGIGTNELVGIVSWPHPESNEVLFTPIFCVLDFLETFVNLH